jgi:hypothetical protein
MLQVARHQPADARKTRELPAVGGIANDPATLFTVRRCRLCQPSFDERDKRLRLTAKVLHFTTCRSSSRITGQPPLACLHQLLRPDVIKALSDPFLAAQFSDTVFTAQAIKHNPEFIFRREMVPGGAANVFDNRSAELFLLRDFVVMFVPSSSTRTELSLNHTLNSVP